ncbi:hypothetical protein KKB99_01355 [bacterium]|nr:hypothetical protein [bacterium]MBU1024632.1 hypothetical protein [bacterium]
MEKKIQQHDFDRLVKRQILRGMKMGYTPDEIIESVKRVTELGFETPESERPARKKTTEPKTKAKRGSVKPGVAVIECSLEQSWDMCSSLREQLDYEFFPVVLSTLVKEGKKLIKYLGEHTVFVTTPFHFSDVHEILKEYGINAINLDLAINRNFLKILKGMHKYKVVGVLAQDEDDLRASTSLVMAYLKQKGKGNTRVVNTLIGEKKTMDDLVANAEIVVYAPNCRAQVQDLLPWGVKKIEIEFDIDPDSIEDLKEHLEKIRF